MAHLLVPKDLRAYVASLNQMSTPVLASFIAWIETVALPLAQFALTNRRHQERPATRPAHRGMRPGGRWYLVPPASGKGAPTRHYVAPGRPVPPRATPVRST